MNYLIDTNLVIDLIRNFQPTAEFLERLFRSESNQIYLSAITNLELHLGRSAKDPKAVREISRLLSAFRIIDLNLEIAGLSGELIRELEIDTVDAIIAATALTQSLILVTKNQKHFTKVKNLKILSP